MSCCIQNTTTDTKKEMVNRYHLHTISSLPALSDWAGGFTRVIRNARVGLKEISGHLIGQKLNEHIFNFCNQSRAR